MTTTRKNRRRSSTPDRARFLGYERDKAALFRQAADERMTQAEIDQRLIALADKWNI